MDTSAETEAPTPPASAPTVQRPDSIGCISFIAIAVAAVLLIGLTMFMVGYGFGGIGDRLSFIVPVVAIAAVLIVAAVRMMKGSKVARIVLTVLPIGPGFAGVALIVDHDYLQGVLCLLGAAILVAMLYNPTANQYFKQK